MKKTLIEVKGLNKSFRSSQEASQSAHALKNIDLTIYEGDIYGIMGSSGAGKSTLLKCLTGLELPTSGKICLNGEYIENRSSADMYSLRRGIGMVFQHFQLFSSRTVAGNISYPMEIYGTSARAREERIDELLDLVSLKGKKHAYPAQLSGGEKQRVGIARALANHPRILFCDEPTSALDSHTTHSFLQLLLELNRTLNLTIVVITHQLDVIKRICNRVAVLSHGEIIEEGLMKEIFAKPTHSVTRHLLHLGLDQIPEELLANRSNNKKLVRLVFEGHQAKEPVISHLVKRYQVEANILSGGLNYLQQTVIGNLIVELSGDPHEIQQSLHFLHSQHITCEILS